MERFENLLLVIGFLALIPVMFLFSIGLIFGHWPIIGYGGGILLLGWCAYKYLQDEAALWLWGSVVLTNLLWWPLFGLTAYRIIFVIQNRGMDQADGYGSPMAFLLGFVGEQILFIPLTLIMLAWAKVVWRTRKSGR